MSDEDNTGDVESAQPVQEEEEQVAQPTEPLNFDENFAAKHPSWKEAFPQIGYACLSMLVALQSGMNTGFSAVFLPQLMADTHFKKFDTDEASWTASLVVLSAPIGGLSIGPFMDRFGRRYACIVANIPPILCWALTYMVDESLWPLYLARIIGGCGGGMMASINVYVAEVCHQNYRGMLMCMIGVFVSGGTMFITLLAAFLEWHTAALVLLVTAIISFVASLFLPESPSWLVSFAPNRKRLQKAEKQIDKLCKAPWLQEYEKAKLLQIYRQNDGGLTSTQSIMERTCCYELKKMNLFHDRTVYYPLIMLIIIFFFQEMSGIFVVLFYSRNLFTGLGKNFGMGLDEYSATVLVGLIRMAMTMTMAYLSMHVGRRKLLLTSSLCMATTICVAGIIESTTSHTMSFARDSQQQETTSEAGVLGLITVLCVLLFVLSAAIGMLSIPWTLLSELLPTRARGIGNGIIMSLSFLTMFFIIKGVPYLLTIISLAGLFFIFTAVCITSALYVYFYVPETFRKDFREIEAAFRNKSKVNS